MTLLNSQFDVIGHDPLKTARAGLMTVLAVEGAGNPYSSLPASGTPVAGDIPSGTIVVMNSSGNAIVADNALATTHAPQMFFVTVDFSLWSRLTRFLMQVRSTECCQKFMPMSWITRAESRWNRVSHRSR